VVIDVKMKGVNTFARHYIWLIVNAYNRKWHLCYSHFTIKTNHSCSDWI